jgi:predicted ribonuclease YlaK/intein/homing endonuclease
MVKYILDTSVIISNPHIYASYDDCEFVIPIIVLEELDNLKHQSGDKARNARIAIKYLNEISNSADIENGIILDNNSKLFIDGKAYRTPIGEDKTNDLRILACAKAHAKDSDVIVLSNDINMKVRARALGIKAESHDTMKTDLSELYSGIQYVYNDEMLADIYEHNNIINPKKYNIELLDNEYAVFDNCDNQSAVGRLDNSGMIHLLNMNHKQSDWIEAQNAEQTCAIDALMNTDIPLVSLIGSSGSGKTLLSVGTAMDMVFNKRSYDKIVIYKSIMSVGEEIGYSPGPQPLTAKIATPDGWTTMVELKIGDFVIGRDGKPTKVLSIHPKGEKEIYKVETTDGTSTECCEDHLWSTKTRKALNKPFESSVKTTREIMLSLNRKDGGLNHLLPRNEAVQYKEQELPLSPYALGAIIGDGCISNIFHNNLNFYNIDKEIVKRVNEELKYINCYLMQKSTINESGNRIQFNINTINKYTVPGNKIIVKNNINGETVQYHSVGAAARALNIKRKVIDNRIRKHAPYNQYTFEVIKKVSGDYSHHPAKNIFNKLGLAGKCAHEKFIPSIYKYNSIENRVNLLRGLMDTDGTIKKSTGEASFTTTSKQLAEDVIEIVRSLGGRASLIIRDRIGKITKREAANIHTRRLSYEFSISLPIEYNPFFLPRKSNRWKKRNTADIKISSIINTGRIEPVQCIMVEDPEHLYLTDNFIVTHNTVQEKLSHWMGAVFDAFEFLLSPKSKEKPTKNGKKEIKDLDKPLASNWKDTLDIYIRNGKINFEAISYIRGRSINNAVVIIDECQNLSQSEIKTILTRAGKNSKFIILGDIEQIDNVRLNALDNGLTYVVEKFKGNPISAHITLKECERSVLAEVASHIL